MPRLEPMQIETGPRTDPRPTNGRQSRSGYTSALEEEGENTDQSVGRFSWCDRYPKLLGLIFAVLVLFAIVGLVSIIPNGVTDWFVHDVIRKRILGKDDDTPYGGISDPRFGTYAAVGAFRSSKQWQIAMGSIRKEISMNRLEQTWETRIDNGYPSVYYDGNKWQIFYSDCEGPKAHHRCNVQLLLYAESIDGWNSAWIKPNASSEEALPANYEYIASYGNNVVAKASGLGVFIDPASKKYVAFGQICIDGSYAKKTPKERSHECPQGYLLRNFIQSNDWRNWVTSPDSAHIINWTQSTEDQRWDCHNNLAYEPHRKLYLATTRTWSITHGRQIGIAVAKKLKNFYKPGYSTQATLPVTTLVGSLQHQTYAQVTIPWHDIFLGFVSVIDTNHDTTYAPTAAPTLLSNMDKESNTGLIHCRLAYSLEPLRGWRFVDRYHDFIPLGHDQSFDSSVCFAAAPVFDGQLERIYYFGGNKPHAHPNRTSALGLATLRKDRFLGLRLAPTIYNAVLTTKPLALTARFLALTFDAPNDSCLQLVSVRSATKTALRGITDLRPQPEDAFFCGQNFTDHRVIDLAPFLDENYQPNDDPAPIIVSLNIYG